jgi:uncharacterized protein YbjT (DUF2867 family)
MKILLLGATVMVGQGVLRECLLDPEVSLVLTIGRSATGARHPKLQEIVHKDLLNYTSLEASLAAFDACFFCLGVASAGMNEEDYSRITCEIPIALAKTLCRLNPAMTFVYVSGVGADSSERGRTMWARVKGRAENALLRLPFRRVCVFRPGFIQPLHGVRSRTRLYRVLYVALAPLIPLLRRAFPNHVLTTEDIGRAMLRVVRHGASKHVLQPADIRALLSADG